MAKILLGATIGDARGSVGGVTYTKGRFGAVLRQKVSPVQPRTSNALNVRGQFGLLSKRWAITLTDAQRLAWIALAAANPRTNIFGNSIILTGLQMYQSVNRNLQLAGGAVVDAAPANLDVTGLATATLAADAAAATLSLAFTATPLAAGHVAIVDATLQVNPGRSFVSSFYRFIFASPVAGISPLDIHAAYLAVWGTLRAGQRITARAFAINRNNGAASTPVTDTSLA